MGIVSLQEALHREQMLETKLAMLQRLLQNTQEASETGWQVKYTERKGSPRVQGFLVIYTRNTACQPAAIAGILDPGTLSYRQGAATHWKIRHP